MKKVNHFAENLKSIRLEINGILHDWEKFMKNNPKIELNEKSLYQAPPIIDKLDNKYYYIWHKDNPSAYNSELDVTHELLSIYKKKYGFKNIKNYRIKKSKLHDFDLEVQVRKYFLHLFPTKLKWIRIRTAIALSSFTLKRELYVLDLIIENRTKEFQKDYDEQFNAVIYIKNDTVAKGSYDLKGTLSFPAPYPSYTEKEKQWMDRQNEQAANNNGPSYTEKEKQWMDRQNEQAANNNGKL